MSGRTPYLDALGDFARRAPARFTVPGHKGGRALPGSLPPSLVAAAALDVPLLIEGVDIAAGGARAGLAPLAEAQTLAAQAWGAARTWFLTGGATQANLAACLAVASRGRSVVVQRSSHTSTFNGLAIAGLDPGYAMPQVDADLGIAHCVEPADLAAALDAAPGAVAAFVVSPTYYGSTADVAGLAAVARARGVALVVDEAWGAHLRFSDRLPQDALAAGADLVISSTHKHLGSLGGSAMLHRSASAPEWIDSAVDRALAVLASTSPSSLLMASLDAARARATVDGPALLDEAIDELAVIRDDIRELYAFDVLDERAVGSFGIAGHDPLRLCVDVRGTGRTGLWLAAALRERDGIELELADERVVVALFGLGESPARSAVPLIAALRRVSAESAARTASGGGRRPRLVERGAHPALPSALTSAASAAGPPFAAPRLSPREALWAAHRSVPIEASHGRIAAEAVVPYPPGIPVLLPGEVIDARALMALRDAVRAGVTLRGASDPTLDHIQVVEVAASATIAAQTGLPDARLVTGARA